jgi:hypothetical protein
MRFSIAQRTPDRRTVALSGCLGSPLSDRSGNPRLTPGDGITVVCCAAWRPGAALSAAPFDFGGRRSQATPHRGTLAQHASATSPSGMQMTGGNRLLAAFHPKTGLSVRGDRSANAPPV